jgi:hypothetical protein
MHVTERKDERESVDPTGAGAGEVNSEGSDVIFSLRNHDCSNLRIIAIRISPHSIY